MSGSEADCLQVARNRQRNKTSLGFYGYEISSFLQATLISSSSQINPREFANLEFEEQSQNS